MSNDLQAFVSRICKMLLPGAAQNLNFTYAIATFTQVIDLLAFKNCSGQGFLLADRKSTIPIEVAGYFDKRRVVYEIPARAA
jgi:hypothetical protein